MQMNKAILIGNLTKDPELLKTTSDVSVAKFTIAVQRKYKNANDEYESDFIPCVAWRNSADFICKHFKKGNKIAVVGSIQTRSYDADDGSKKYVTEVVIEDSEFVQPKKSEDNKPEENKQSDMQPIDEDNLPF